MLLYEDFAIKSWAFETLWYNHQILDFLTWPSWYKLGAHLYKCLLYETSWYSFTILLYSDFSISLRDFLIWSFLDYSIQLFQDISTWLCRIQDTRFLDFMVSYLSRFFTCLQLHYLIAFFFTKDMIILIFFQVLLHWHNCIQVLHKMT